MKRISWLLLTLALGCGDDGGSAADAQGLDTQGLDDVLDSTVNPRDSVGRDTTGTDTSGTDVEGRDTRVPDAGPRPEGVLIVDPDNPAWLRYEGGEPFFLCGPGDPEQFLYLGSRNADGTRDGNQSELIAKLAPTGANGIYFQIVRSHGGDGDSTHNPFIDSDPTMGLDEDILNQWEGWFDEMEAAGIVIYLFIYDDSARIWNTGDDVGAEERTFLEEIVNRFEHHPSLIWVVGEEYGERYQPARISNIARVISDADDGDHAIGVHKNAGIDFIEFADDPHLDQFSIQLSVTEPNSVHDNIVTAFNAARGRYNLTMSEGATHGSGQHARLVNWAVAMGGAYVMVFEADIESTAVSDLMDCGRLVRFMEATTFYEMEPNDGLALGSTQWVLANSGNAYIAYAAAPEGSMGVRGLDLGMYELYWFDPIDGDEVRETIDVTETDANFSVPSSIGPEVAVYLSRMR